MLGITLRGLSVWLTWHATLIKIVLCGDGYALQNGECLQCNYTDENCEGCEASDLNACFKCIFGSFLSADRQCVQCSSGCTGCLSSEVCYSGFRFDFNFYQSPERHAYKQNKHRFGGHSAGKRLINHFS